MLRATESVDPGPGAPASPEAAEPAPGSGGKAVSSSVLVRDTGFQEDDWFSGYVEWSGADSLDSLPDRAALHLDNCASAEEIAPAFERITLIRIAFPSHMDGRGFSLARHLRLLGYRGRLRASGHLLADQYAMARRNGFDEVEIDRSLAKRQPEEQWLFRADWRRNDYQERLRRHPRAEVSRKRVRTHPNSEASPLAPEAGSGSPGME